MVGHRFIKGVGIYAKRNKTGHSRMAFDSDQMDPNRLRNRDCRSNGTLPGSAIDIDKISWNNSREVNRESFFSSLDGRYRFTFL
jgi:hypothetical protein